MKFFDQFNMGMRGDGAFTLMYKVVFGIVFLIAITMVFIALASLVYGYKNSLVAVPSELQAHVISYRFTHSADCFAFKDESLRVHPLSVDLSHFTVDRMNACYEVLSEKDYEKYNFKLVLQERKIEIESGNYYEAPDFTFFYDVSVVDPVSREWLSDVLVVYVQKPFKDKPLSGRVPG